MALTGGVGGSDEQPQTASRGYVHWSSFIYSGMASEPKFASSSDGWGIVSTKPGPYASELNSNWNMFTCPELDSGGLPPTDPANGNFNSWMSSERINGMGGLPGSRGWPTR